MLAAWSGWGATPEIFDETDTRRGAARDRLRGLIESAGWDAARRTVLNAHYTDPTVVRAMWDAAAALGFGGGSVLEPGCGSGNFLAFSPAGAVVVGVERDPTTAAIARALYPDATIQTGPFEQFDPAQRFDLVIGNVPFAKLTPHDSRYNRGRHSLHNYFLIKALALTRPGGLLLALTSRYTLDARNPAARRELAQLGDLLGALRLPNGAMRAVAGTDAILDVIVLRRRESGAPPAGATGWDRTTDVEVPNETTGEPAQVQVNCYLAAHPEAVLGTSVVGRGMYRDGELVVRPNGPLAAIGDQTAAALDRLVAATPLRYVPPATPAPTVPPARRVLQIGEVALDLDRRIPLRQGSFVAAHNGALYRHTDGDLVLAEIPTRAIPEVQALITLRDATLNLLDLEAGDAPDPDIEAARTALAGRYERYRHRWGPLNRVTWARTGRHDPVTGEERRRRIPARLGGFRHDPDWPTLSAIEVYDEDLGVASAATILRQRTIHPPAPRLGADTAQEALAISLDETGRVDLERIAELLGVDEPTASLELAEHVYTDPTTGQLVPAEEYLSGNVRAKLAAARTATAGDSAFARNVGALEAVQPAQLGPGEISVAPGAPWISPTDIEAFVTEMLGAPTATVTYTPGIGSWDLTVPDGCRSTVAMTIDWGTGRRPAVGLFEQCLNQRLAKVYDEIDDGDRTRLVLNIDETAAARAKQEALTERFSTWIWEDPDRATRVAERYNALFNSYVSPTYTGAHLSLPGLVSTFIPHAHQRGAVARIIREGRCLLAHAVGAGKTATMVMSGMEMRRLGLVNRPAYVVPNHMLEQFSREFLQLYPQARVLITSRELTGRAGRQAFVARCATGDWDAVVITHSAFERLPLRADTYRDYTGALLTDIRAALSDTMTNQAEHTRGLVKKLEAAVARAEAKLEHLLATASKDDGICFEETGIDYLFVDELHLFKNRAVISGVEGVRSDGSRRASDLDAKVWTLTRSRGHRVLCGATATPIANTVVEAWIMQTYLQPDVLAEAGLDSFDAWAATFAQTVAAVELAPDGGSYRVTSRLARYRNVPELIAAFRRTADVRIRDDLQLTLPSLRGGKAEAVVVPASDQLRDYVDSLVARAEAIRNRAVQPDEDNMLKVTSDGRHAALDLRLVDRDPDPTGGKIEAAAQRIAAIHRDTRHLTYLDEAGQPAPRSGGFQIVFCDLSTPKDDGTWSAYTDLRRRLITHGIPAGEIAFIHDARNDEARARLFARCRNGQIAVLIGSTNKMGVGTNIHTRAVALHHLDCPWRPADIEQREGRVIRQGNQNTEVDISRYATEASFDVYMWQTCERKAGFIDQVMRGHTTGRELDDIGDAVLSYAEVKALATGNPLVIEQAGIQAEITKLERLAAAHRNEQHRLARTITAAHQEADRLHARATALQAAIDRRTDTTGDRFTIDIDGTHRTSRVEAGTVLLDHLRDAIVAGARHPDATYEAGFQPIGRLGGFPIHLDTYKTGLALEARLTIALDDTHHIAVRLPADELTTKKPEALIAQLEGPIRKLDEQHTKTLADAQSALTRAELAEDRHGQPYTDQARLDQLRYRYQTILDELSPEAERPRCNTGLSDPPSLP